MAIDIGRINYQAYCDQLKDNLPKWEEIGQKQQDAWRHSAVAVLQYIREAQKQMEEDPELIG